MTHDKQVLATNLMFLQGAEEIRATLESIGIPVLFLKGSAFLDTLYKDLGERPMCDVDILIPQDKRHEVDAALRDARFEMRVAADRPATRARLYNWAYIRGGNSPLCVEAHVRFGHEEPYTIDYDGIWKRAVTYQTQDRRIPTLSPEDSLLYTSLHEAKHSFIWDERPSEDLRRILTEWSPSWDAVLARAKQWGMRNALYISLLRATNHGVEIPSDVLRQLAPSGARAWLVHRLIDPRTGDARYRRETKRLQLAMLVACTDSMAGPMRFVSHWSLRRVQDVLAQVRS